MEGFEKYVSEYGEYLEDIRKRLYMLVIIFVALFIIGFFLTTPLVKIMIQLLHIQSVSITVTSPFQIIDLAMDVGVFFAVVFTGPILLYHMYAFLRSGLLRKERKIFFFLVPISILLFVTGFSYGFATMWYALRLIAEVNVGLGVVNLWDVSTFISQMVLTSTLLGVIFEFPIIITFLIRIGMMQTQFLKSKRRQAIVIIFIFVSLLPPTDGLSLILMSVPLILIYELTILLNSQKRNTYHAPLTN